ncbi:hypothetical protein BDA99DRAFT_503113 [Phascolomyces articulosus]|uniref:Uncharacterized protein n=1 Tax=Phascolomyces articulosus TaxID=60185 RepID=A0AAD5K4G0_9FUNG|nr:hypothetical protein BDA99DRAFT_503113 [Phascolomyces articulosus]
MAYYEADCEDLFCDDDTTLSQYYDSDNDQRRPNNTFQHFMRQQVYNDETDEEEEEEDNDDDDDDDLKKSNDNDQGDYMELQQQLQNELNDIEMTIEDDGYDDGTFSDDSEYSLDYEYLGPRNPNYRNEHDPDSDASELSDSEYTGYGHNSNRNYPHDQQQPEPLQQTATGFDMWDEDPYSTNDYTWESNDMRLTHFIKFRQNELNQLLLPAWRQSSFWRKDKGWPKQLPSSCSTTNHDQAANALCMVLSNYGMAEQLYAIYRNRIFECGRPCRPPCHTTGLSSADPFHVSSSSMHPANPTSSSLSTVITTTTPVPSMPTHQQQRHDTLTWIDSDHVPYSSSSSPLSSSTTSALPFATTMTSSSSWPTVHQQQPTFLSSPLPTTSSIPLASSSSDIHTNTNNNNDDDDNNTNQNVTTSTSSGGASSSSGSKFCETHLSVSLRRSTTLQPSNNEESASTATTMTTTTITSSSSLPPTGISRFRPFTKYIRRADFPPVYAQDSYLALDFEPLCLAHKYGYMAIGGLEGEFELYCCMEEGQQPRKIWGTKFKSRNNVQLMTNAIQIVRWKKPSSRMQQDHGENDDGRLDEEGGGGDGLGEEGEYDYMLIACMNEAGILVYKLPSHRECQSMPACRQEAQHVVQLYTHLRCFDRVAVNDAKVSHDGKRMVCVGDDAYIFMLDTQRHPETGAMTFGQPEKLHVPCHLLKCNGGPGQEMPYSSQYVAWSQSSQHFAHTSDTHANVFVWRADTKQALYSIDAAGYTYAIAFHPRLEGVLAFTNRYGYFHTVNLEEAVKKTTLQEGKEVVDGSRSNEVLNILDFDHQTPKSRGHVCTNQCMYFIASAAANTTKEQSDMDHPANHTTDLHAHQEITMVSFRGERDRRLRILAKINGIQWSNDGRYLYVATKKRILAYEFIKTSQSISTLLDVTGKQARRLLERFRRQPLLISPAQVEEAKSKRAAAIAATAAKKKKQGSSSSFGMSSTPRRKPSRKRKRDDPEENNSKMSMAWLEKWLSVPLPVRHRILGETQLASHW